jgi:hypothetical protein
MPVFSDSRVLLPCALVRLAIAFNVRCFMGPIRQHCRDRVKPIRQHFLKYFGVRVAQMVTPLCSTT